jgi:hypothetical protein
MTIQKLASEIAKREGKKSQARIGDIREILAVLVQLDGELKFSGDVKDTPIWMLDIRSSKVAAKIKRRKLKK